MHLVFDGNDRKAMWRSISNGLAKSMGDETGCFRPGGPGEICADGKGCWCTMLVDTAAREAHAAIQARAK